MGITIATDVILNLGNEVTVDLYLSEEGHSTVSSLKRTITIYLLA